MELARPFALPCDAPRIVSRQGWRRLPSETDWRWHNGVDLRPSNLPADGAPLYAIADGIVRWSVESGTPRFRGYGRAVVLEHAPDVLSLYAHNAENLVAAGEHVQAGQQIASMGRTSGRNGDPAAMISGGAHVHLELVLRWPLAADDTRGRYDVLASLATGGIVEVGGRLVRRGAAESGLPEAASAYVIPSGLTTDRPPDQHPDGTGGFVDLVLMAYAARLINRGRVPE